MSGPKSNGKSQLRDFVVTYRYDCYENVRAVDSADAARKVERAMSRYPGRRNIEIIDVEEQ